MDQSTCPNCGLLLLPEHHFCPECGQKTGLTRLSIKDIVLDIFHTVTGTIGLPSLAFNLLIRPGEVAREFVVGKRKSWFPPFSFLILVVGISSLLIGETHIISTQTQPVVRSVGEILDRHANVIIFLNVPILAFFNWFFFRKAGYNYAEHLVFSAFTSGLKSIFFSLLVVPIAYVFPEHYKWAILFYMVAWFVYFSWADVQFIQNRSSHVRLKGFIVPILMQMFTILAVLSIILVWKGKSLLRHAQEKKQSSALFSSPNTTKIPLNKNENFLLSRGIHPGR